MNKYLNKLIMYHEVNKMKREGHSNNGAEFFPAQGVPPEQGKIQLCRNLNF
jgi:hypothetical protein